ncbi:sugar phosphate isomerase/epimerase family protein [Caldanaerobius polysaccharolyticus]|uniref:sugar phosphate isomerase/epimerase family protein n=1 Tax=Caldanaerobius polysaccharolyticus TaxID=44256 RepID=UPI00047C5011|nr:sugar phosphate isomerase/epimerase family protein [Caldanaerobius polysaccharolyticus]
MKIGVSTYSLSKLIYSRVMDVLDVIQWIADNGGEHVEIVPFGFDLFKNPELVDAIRKKAEDVGIDISNYAIGANFIQKTEQDYENEIKRVMGEVDVAYRLGVKFMRHDVAWRPLPEVTVKQLDEDLPRLAEACRRIADYAAQYGITTSVENHGFFIQGSERVQRLIHAVGRPNFKTTLDVGNFLCVDEDPVVAVKKNLPYASMIHLKDFYYRPFYRNPGEGWFQTAGGNFLRGAIVGHGDIDMWSVIKAIKRYGYDGYISIEFEGMEDCRVGSKIGLDNARRIWNEV